MIAHLKKLLQFSFSQILEHKAIYSLLWLTMLFVFLVQLVLSSLSMNIFASSGEDREWSSALYAAEGLSLTSSEVDTLFEEFLPYKDQVRDISISSRIPISEEVILYPENGKPVIAAVAFFPEAHPDRFFDPDQRLKYSRTEDIYINDELVHQVYLYATGLDEVSREGGWVFKPNLTSEEQSRYLINDLEWHVAGGVSFKIPGATEASACVYLSYDAFFVMNRVCENVYLQCIKPLSQTDLDRLNHVLKEVSGPDNFFQVQSEDIDPAEVKGIVLMNAMILAAVVIVLVNLLSLHDYILFLRRSEFSVYQLVGGTKKTVWFLGIVELLVCAMVSLVSAWIVVQLPFFNNLVTKYVWSFFGKFFALNAGAYILILLIAFILRMSVKMSKKSTFFSGGSR